MSAGNGSAAKKMVALERREQVLALRKVGASITRIAAELGISRTTAHRQLWEAIDEARERRVEAADRLIDLELERLEYLWFSLRAKVKKGDPAAVMAALKVHERRCKLLGIEPATKLDVAGPSGGPLGLPPMLAGLSPPASPEELRHYAAIAADACEDTECRVHGVVVAATDEEADDGL